MPTMKTLPTVTAGAIETVLTPADLPASEIEGAIRYSQSDDTLYTYDGAAWNPIAGGGGSGITQLTGGVTAGPGSGSQAATVVSVGGQSAANVAAGTVLANAATNLNTASAIVKRDASGNFVAGTITAALTGTASGNPPNSRAINTSAPLAGGGDLSADRTLSIPVSTNSVDGYLSAADHTTFAAKVGPSRNIATSAPLTGGGNLSADLTLGIPVATNVADGYLSSTDHATFSASAANAITSLTGDVTASGPGASAATVASVGGTAANFIAQGANAANSASAANTSTLIVRRDALGSFSATTVTANLVGNVTGNVSGTALNVTGTVAIANGGSGQTSANAALNAFLPTQTGNANKFLQTDGTNTSWATSTVPNVTQGASGTVLSAGQLLGTNTNDAASAGYVGEIVSASVQKVSSVDFDDVTPVNIMSIVLTAGDWDVSSIFILTANSGGASTTGADYGLSTNSASFTGTIIGYSQGRAATIPTATSDSPCSLPSLPFSVANATTQTVYMVGKCSSSGGIGSAYGSMIARRVR